MIKSFADRETEKVYNQQFSRKLPSTIQRIALRKLIMIDGAENLNDLRVPRRIDLKRCTEIGRGSTAFASTINTAYALLSDTAISMTWRSWTIIERED